MPTPPIRKDDAESGAGHFPDPRVYLALERTFLAWLRTGIALMGFGFVVARFGILLRELGAGGSQFTLPNSQLSMQFGIGLVLIGVLVNLVSAFRYRAVVKRMESGIAMHGPSHFAMLVGIGLAIAGAVVAVRLLLVG